MWYDERYLFPFPITWRWPAAVANISIFTAIICCAHLHSVCGSIYRGSYNHSKSFVVLTLFIRLNYAKSGATSTEQHHQQKEQNREKKNRPSKWSVCKCMRRGVNEWMCASSFYVCVVAFFIYLNYYCDRVRRHRLCRILFLTVGENAFRTANIVVL